jgi:hypothetical protein
MVKLQSPLPHFI